MPADEFGLHARWSAASPASGWPGAQRFRRVALMAFVGLVGVPVAGTVVITATFAGWTPIAVAAILGCTVVVMGVIAGRFVLGNIRPVTELIAATSHLADGDYTARLPVRDAGAMMPAVTSFNRMAQRLEESDELRRRLLADVGHELRTPLTIVRGHIEAMADGVRALNESELYLLLDDIASMERLLDDLRLLSAAEAGMIELEIEEVDLADLAQQIVNRFAGHAEALDVQLHTNLERGATAMIDPHRILQVLSNLLANALRAVTPGDEITVTVSSAADGTRRIEVADTGEGIAEDRLGAIFDRFHKGLRSGGSGLGLSISRDLVEAHGGKIVVESELGDGTTVGITLPAPVASD